MNLSPISRQSYTNKVYLYQKNNDSNFNNINYYFGKNKKKIKTYPFNLSIETINNLKDFKKFYSLPFKLFKNNPFWIPPFWGEYKDFFKQKNPFWKHSEGKLFIVRKNSKIVGRIGAIIDHKFCETIGEKIGYFGFFECIQDYKIAQSLFQTAQDWLTSKDIEIMRGPIDGRVDLGCGFLYEGFDSPPSLLSSYSPQYYNSFAEKFCMKKVRDQVLYHIDLTKPIPKKLEEKAKQCIASGIKIRNFSRLHIKRELKWWVELFLQTFKNHWGYVPVSKEEVTSRFGMRQLRWIVDPRLFLIAESNGSPVAYIWSTPDFNQIFKNMNGQLGLFQILQFFLKKKQINKGKLQFIGIKEEFRNRNIGSYLNYETLIEMKKRGYVGADVLIDEGNAVAQTTIAITGAKPIKKYRVFEKKLNNSS